MRACEFVQPSIAAATLVREAERFVWFWVILVTLAVWLVWSRGVFCWGAGSGVLGKLLLPRLNLAAKLFGRLEAGLGNLRCSRSGESCLLVLSECPDDEGFWL